MHLRQSGSQNRLSWVAEALIECRPQNFGNS
jgi:hypothetical protein